MSRVEFEEEKGSILYGHFERSTDPPQLVKWLLKMGIVKTMAQANAVILISIIVLLIATVYIVKGVFFKTVEPAQATLEQDL